MFYIKTKQGYTSVRVSILGDTVTYVDNQEEADGYYTKRAAMKDASWYEIDYVEIVEGEIE